MITTDAMACVWAELLSNRKIMMPVDSTIDLFDDLVTGIKARLPEGIHIETQDAYDRLTSHPGRYVFLWSDRRSSMCGCGGEIPITPACPASIDDRGRVKTLEKPHSCGRFNTVEWVCFASLSLTNRTTGKKHYFIADIRED